ncbi:MAG: DUF1905 domain-containing protein [Nonomuraea sp.]|nr:DUF1905 domain-containing protein [Nonomuraea sp.]
MSFHATIELGGKTATGIEIPAEVVESLGAGKRPAVRATVNGYSYRTTVAPMGGRFLMPFSAEHRAASGLEAGDEVEVELVVDTEPRAVEVPEDLALALAGNPAAREFFETLSYSRKSRITLAVAGAKKPETRQRRIDDAVAKLAAGEA